MLQSLLRVLKISVAVIFTTSDLFKNVFRTLASMTNQEAAK